MGAYRFLALYYPSVIVGYPLMVLLLGHSVADAWEFLQAHRGLVVGLVILPIAFIAVHWFMQRRTHLVRADEEVQPKNDAVDRFVDQFRAIGIDGEPASAREIEQLEELMHLSLPASYKAYLRIAGRESTSCLLGSNCALRHLPELRAAADALLGENGLQPLSANAFVFLMHQGYQFFFFEADGYSDDPPVFYYLECEPAIVRRFERFSDFVCTPDSAAG